MKFNKKLILSSLTALVFSHNLVAQEFDLSADFISQYVETNMSNMLMDIETMHTNQDVLNEVAYQLNNDFGPTTQRIEWNTDNDTGLTDPLRLTE
ncbi:MAG: hypothetical protein ACI9C4_001194 [Paraglaciecola sp.]|jgi:hypothetical protein